MNGAVSESQFSGFSLRLRTASSGSYVLPPIYSNMYSVADGEVTFQFTAAHAKALTEGQYYKIQLAYCASQEKDETGKVNGKDIGYYSTVGVAKCISKPEVSIRNLVFENINAFNNEYFGLYDLTNCKDRTEKVYSYEFKIYDEQDNVFYTTGEKLHQAYYDVDYTSSLDRITINDFTSNEIVYSIEYTVTTLNGLVMSSPRYKISSQYLVAPSNNIKILPQADWEHGVIDVHFEGETDPAHSYYYILDEDLLNSLEVDDNGNPVVDDSNQTMVSKTQEVLYYYEGNDKLVYLRNNSLYKFYRFNTNSYHYQFLNNKLSNMIEVNGKYYYKSDVQTYVEMGIEIPDEALTALDYYEKIISGRNLLKSLTYEYVENNFIDLSKEYVISTSEHEKKYFGSYLLSRASDEDNYRTWFNIARFRMDDQIPSDFSIRDVTIEHGRKYKYALQQYNIWGLASARIVSDIFEASFEDVFLFDGERSLRVRYNPAIDTFKTTILEQKTDTIGGRYPFITRNGATYYKEFPLGGLLAQEIDDMHYFVDPHYGDAHRHATSDTDKKTPDNAFLNYHDFSDTVIALERNFKLKVLEWLNDGKPKLFKSPYEGNYIIRLMNVSLTPVKELGRMLHSFTSQAYEIAECTYDNLVAFGFIKPTSPSDLIGLWKSYDLTDPSLRDSNGDVVIEFEHGVQSFTIQDLMPGDIIYLTFSDQEDELPIMIGITGSYTYEGIDSNLIKIRIPQPEDHDLIGKIDAFYTGMRVTDFDSIVSMMLKTIVSQQYVGTSPWMQRLKITNWLDKNNYDQYWRALQSGQYKELQNYNFRTYLDQVVKSNGDGSYAPTENFAKLAWSFDPGELLDRINLTIHKGQKYKTELLNMEMMRFRERPLIPVFTETPRQGYIYVPGQFKSLLEERGYKEKTHEAEELDRPGSYQPVNELLVSTTPFGYPHPIEELQEYEMLDPFCIYQVFYYDNTLDDWIPYPGQGQDTCYYDPYYRSWMAEEYDPTVKMDFEWVQVAFLEDQIIGYCTEAQLENFTNYNVSITGLYWVGDNEEIKFNLSHETLDRLRAEPDEQAGYILPVYAYTDDSQYLVERNRIHQANKKKKERGEYIDQAINEKEMFDYRLRESWVESSNSSNIHYHYVTKKGTYDIKNNKYDLFEKINDQYFVTGSNTIEPNKVYWVKQYNIQLNMTTEKVVEYKNIDLMNSYHIGNGVVAELTFQLRVIDYYTEIYDNDVRIAKENYLNAKQFYSQLMKTYNIIAKANLNRNVNHGFMELYDKLIKGNGLGEHLDESDEATIRNALEQSGSKEELKLQSLYLITMINTAHERGILNLLVNYKSQYSSSEWDEAFKNAEVYHYYKMLANSETDVNYIIDKSNFDDPENPFYIIDSSTGNYTITEDNAVTYRYRYYADGNIYYYKVNKNAYLDEYMEQNPAMNRSELVVLYVPNAGEGEPKFIVASEASLLSTGSEVQELTQITEPVTTQYLDLLNKDEVAALKLEDYFITLEYDFITNGVVGYCSEVDAENCYENYRIEAPFDFYIVTSDDKKFGITNEGLSQIYTFESPHNATDATIYSDTCLLYEETEILSILNGEAFQGVSEKNKDLNSEIDKINKDINDSQSSTDSLKLTYINAYAKLMQSIDEYNTVVYQDWCARILYDLLNTNSEFYTKYYNGASIFKAVPIGTTGGVQVGNSITDVLVGYCTEKDFQECRISGTPSNTMAYYYQENNNSRIYLNEYIFYRELSQSANTIYTHKIQTPKYYVLTSGSYVPCTDTQLLDNKEYYTIYNNFNYVTDWVAEQRTDSNTFLTNLGQVFSRALSESKVELVEEEEEVKNLLYAANALYESVAGNLPKVQVYQRMIADNKDDARLDDYLQEQIAIQTGQIVLEFYAMYKAIAALVEILQTDTRSFFTQELQESYVSTCANLIDKYNTLHDQLIINGSFKTITDTIMGYADITAYILNLRQLYNELYNNQIVEALQTTNGRFEMIDIAKLSIYHNDESFLSEIIVSDQALPPITLIYWNYEYDGTGSSTINSHKTARGINAGATGIYGENIVPRYGDSSTWYDPVTGDAEYNIFAATVENWSGSERTTFMSPGYKNNAVYFYRSGFNLLQNQNQWDIPVPYFIINPRSELMLDPELEYLDKAYNSAVFDSLTSTQKNKVLRLCSTLCSTMAKMLSDLSGSTSAGYISSIRTKGYIKSPSSAGTSLYTRRAILIGLLEKMQSDNNGKILKDLVDAAQIYLNDFYLANKPEQGNPPALMTFPNIKVEDADLEIGLDTKIDEEYYIPYKVQYINGELAPIAQTDSDGAMNYYKDVLLRGPGCNWYQPIYLDDNMLKHITKVELDDKNESGELIEEGLYWEYLQTYLEKVEDKNQLLEEAQDLVRLYEKQLQVYTEKYNKYYDEYMTNQDIYSSYFGTEAFNYYNLLNSDESDEDKNAAIQAKKAVAQEAWWKFLNLLDARYTAEKERGMYV